MKHGFTLIELAIVLVIIGLIAGGVIAGQSLIRAAELRSVVTDIKNYQNAVMSFRERYFQLPGDMTNATDFWTEMTNCGAASPSGSGTQTCNGNGDGILDVSAAAGQTGERFLFWQHLSNAGLIAGTYTGAAGPDHFKHAVVGQNVPESKLGGAGWATGESDNTGGVTTGAFTQNYRNFLLFGRTAASGTRSLTARVLKPIEAWGIDSKVDDGMPAQGFVSSYFRPRCTDGTDDTNFDAEYDVQRDEVECILMVKDIFGVR